VHNRFLTEGAIRCERRWVPRTSLSTTCSDVGGSSEPLPLSTGSLSEPGLFCVGRCLKPRERPQRVKTRGNRRRHPPKRRLYTRGVRRPIGSIHSNIPLWSWSVGIQCQVREGPPRSARPCTAGSLRVRSICYSPQNLYPYHTRSFHYTYTFGEPQRLSSRGTVFTELLDL
jgi:hypothetical protein